MIVYIFADTLFRQNAKGVTETRIFHQAVCGASNPDEAYEVFINTFEESKECHEGWRLVGAPSKIDVTQETLEIWSEHITVADVVQFGGPKLVK